MWIYIAAIVKYGPDDLVYAKEPLGPYRDDETEALARGEAALREMYGTERIERLESHYTRDLTDVRVILKAQARREDAAKQAATVPVQEDVSASTENLDRVLELLGVCPDDV